MEFMLCPSLEKSFQEEIGGPGTDYMDYFEMPWRRVGDLIPEDTDLTRFYPYYDEIKDNMEIDEWGVGHESSPTSMHMTRMLHPLADAEEVEEIQHYPIPVYTEEKNASGKRQGKKPPRKRPGLRRKHAVHHLGDLLVHPGNGESDDGYVKRRGTGRSSL